MSTLRCVLIWNVACKGFHPGFGVGKGSYIDVLHCVSIIIKP